MANDTPSTLPSMGDTENLAVEVQRLRKENATLQAALQRQQGLPQVSLMKPPLRQQLKDLMEANRIQTRTDVEQVVHEVLEVGEINNEHAIASVLGSVCALLPLESVAQVADLVTGILARLNKGVLENTILGALSDVGFQVQSKDAAVIQSICQLAGISMPEMMGIPDIQALAGTIKKECKVASKEDVTKSLMGWNPIKFGSLNEVLCSAYTLGVGVCADALEALDLNNDVAKPLECPELESLKETVKGLQADMLKLEDVSSVSTLKAVGNKATPEDITQLVNKTMDGARATRTDACHVISDLCRTYTIPFDSFLTHYPVEMRGNTFDLIKAIIKHNDLDSRDVIGALLDPQDIVRYLGCENVKGLHNWLQERCAAIQRPINDIPKAMATINMKSFSNIQEALHVSHVMGMLAVMDKGPEVSNLCGIPTHGILKNSGAQGNGQGGPDEPQTMKHSLGETFEWAAKETETYSVSEVTSILKKVIQHSVAQESPVDMMPMLIKEMLDALECKEPVQIKSILRDVVDLMRVNVSEFITDVAQTHAISVLDITSNILESHTQSAVEKKVSKEKQSVVFWMIHGLVKSYLPGFEALFQEMEPREAVRTFRKVFPNLGMDLSSVVAHLCQYNKDTVMEVMAGVANECKINIDDYVDHIPEGINRPSTITRFAKKYRMSYVEAITENKVDATIGLIQEIMQRQQIDYSTLLKKVDKSVIIRLMKDHHVTVDDMTMASTVTSKNELARLLLSLEKAGQEPTAQSKTQVCAELCAVMKYYRFTIFDILPYTNLSAHDCRQLMEMANVPMVDVIKASKDILDCRQACHELIAKAQLSPLECLQFVPKEGLSTQEVFRYFDLNNKDVIGILQHTRETSSEASIEDMLELYGTIDHVQVAKIVRKFNINPSLMIPCLQLTQEEGVEMTKAIIKNSGMDLKGVVSILKMFPFGIADIAKHYRVNISDIMKIIRHFEITLFSVLDVMLIKDSKDGVSDFIAGACTRYDLPPHAMTFDGNLMWKHMATEIKKGIKIKSLKSLGLEIDWMMQQPKPSLAQLAKMSYLWGVIAGIARTKGPQSVHSIEASITQGLVLPISDMLDSIDVLFPVKDAAVSYSLELVDVGVQALPDTCSVDTQCKSNGQSQSVQVSSHVTTRFSQTRSVCHVDNSCQYIYKDCTAEVAMQTEAQVWSKTVGCDPIATIKSDVAVSCHRVTIPLEMKSCQTTIRVNHVGMLTDRITTGQAAIQTNTQQHNTLGCMALPDSVDCGLQTNILPAMMSIHTDSNFINMKDQQCQTYQYNIRKCNTQTEAIRTSDVSTGVSVERADAGCNPEATVTVSKAVQYKTFSVSTGTSTSSYSMQHVHKEVQVMSISNLDLNDPICRPSRLRNRLFPSPSHTSYHPSDSDSASPETPYKNTPTESGSTKAPGSFPGQSSGRSSFNLNKVYPVRDGRQAAMFAMRGRGAYLPHGDARTQFEQYYKHREMVHRKIQVHFGGTKTLADIKRLGLTEEDTELMDYHYVSPQAQHLKSGKKCTQATNTKTPIEYLHPSMYINSLEHILQGCSHTLVVSRQIMQQAPQPSSEHVTTIVLDNAELSRLRVVTRQLQNELERRNSNADQGMHKRSKIQLREVYAREKENECLLALMLDLMRTTLKRNSSTNFATNRDSPPHSFKDTKLGEVAEEEPVADDKIEVEGTNFSYRQVNDVGLLKLKMPGKEFDGSEWVETGEVDLYSPSLKFITGYAIGLRFVDIPLKQGTRIQGARLVFHASSSHSAESEWTIFAEKVANAPPLSNETSNISDREPSNQSATHTIGPWKAGRSFVGPDLSLIVQEILNEPDWQPGNAIVFLISAMGCREAHSYAQGDGEDYSPSLKLQIPADAFDQEFDANSSALARSNEFWTSMVLSQ